MIGLLHRGLTVHRPVMLLYAVCFYALQVLRKQTVRSFSHPTVQRNRNRFQLPRRRRWPRNRHSLAPVIPTVPPFQIYEDSRCHRNCDLRPTEEVKVKSHRPCLVINLGLVRVERESFETSWTL